MEKKRKRVFPAVIACAVVIAALASLGLILADGAYRDIGAGLLSAAAAAFVADFLILLLFKRRSVPAGIVKAAAILLVNAVLFTAAGIYWFGPVAIFRPHADTEAEAALAEHPQVIWYESEDGKLSGWRYISGQPDAPVILCFYGNGETASRKLLEFIGYIAAGYYDGFDVAVFDYPGYGHAPGRPTEESLKETALAAYDYLHGSYETICLFGYSIGTGAANYVAANRDAAGLALMAPYADGYDLYQNVLPLPLTGWLHGLVSFRMDSAGMARKVTVHALLLVTERDEIVPLASSERLWENYAEASFVRVDVPGHAGFWNSAECLRLTSDYFREAVS